MGENEQRARVWVVGQLYVESWDLGGIFTTPDQAEAACSSPNDCVFPVPLDEYLGRETVMPPGITFPKRA